MKTTYLRINPADNVAVAISPLHAGETIEADGRVITLHTDVPAGHKVTLKNFQAGENIIKYGYPIGHVTVDVPEGTWVSEKEIKTNLAGLLDYTYQPVEVHTDIPVEHRTFKGYRRRNGDVGVRNEIWIIPTVGCVNGIVNQLAEGLRHETDGGKGVDAIVAFPHNYGCSQLGEDHENTKKILRDMVLHPNAGAVLVVGLGCENNQPDVFREFIGTYDEDRIRFMVAQKVDDEYEEGMRILRELYAKCCQDERTDVPLSELRVGLKCGGSDGFSGITANPLLGMFSDYLIVQGGTSVLTEVPEMFGAETILMNRCRTTELFNQTVSVINRSRHQRVRFVTGVAEHQTLVTGTGFERIVRGLVNALLDVSRLLVVADENGTAAVVNAVFGIVIANLTEGVAGNADVIDLSGGGDFASEHDKTRSAEGFCSDAAVGILLENGIENGVRDLVRHLVRMAFTHRFRRKKIIAAHRMLPNLEYSAFAKSNQRACDRRFSGN